MNYRGLKAVKAFAFGVVLSGLVTGCNEASQVAKTVAPEAEAVNASASKGLQSAQLTAEERETKKREFFAKPEVKEMSAGLEEIAEAVAVAVEDKELRERIYAKCMEKFDGETNVLWQQLEGDDNLRAKGGWNKRIDDLVGKDRKNTIVKGVGNVDAAVKKFEKTFGAPLHLFWMYPSKWDKKTTPLVAFVPMDMDPALRKSIPMFDSKGNRYELDQVCTIAKERPVLIITYNERTYLNGTKKSLAFAGSHEQMSPVNGTYTFSTPVTTNLKKNNGQLTAATLNQKLEQVTITYPYNKDEAWSGGVEFWVVLHADLTYGDNYTSTSTSGLMLPGQDLNNSSTIYTFTNPISFPLSTTVGDLPASYTKFTCEYFESDGAFFLDDFIASHKNIPFIFASRTYTDWWPSGDWFLPANGGTVMTTYFSTF